MERHYGAGEVMARRDEILPYLIRVDAGRVRIETAAQTWFLSDGDCFGEEGVFLGKPAPYTALAAEETTATLFSETEAAAFLSANPAAALLAVQRTVARLHETTAPLTPDNPRYLHLLRMLLPHAPREGDPASFTRVPFDLAHLAGLVGTTPEAVRILLTGAAPFGDVSISDEGAILVKGAEHIRRRITEVGCASFFAAAPRRPQGRGRYNLLSRIT